MKPPYLRLCLDGLIYFHSEKPFAQSEAGTSMKVVCSTAGYFLAPNCAASHLGVYCLLVSLKEGVKIYHKYLW